MGSHRHLRIIENIEFGPDARSVRQRGALPSCCRRAISLFATTTCTARRTDGGLGVVNWEVPYGVSYTGPGVVDNVVIYDNLIHDNGNLNADIRPGRPRHQRQRPRPPSLGRGQPAVPEQRRRHPDQRADRAARDDPSHLRRPQRVARQQADRLLGQGRDRRDRLAERGVRPSARQLVARAVHGRAVRAGLGLVHLQPPPRLRLRRRAASRTTAGTRPRTPSSSATSFTISITRSRRTRATRGGPRPCIDDRRQRAPRRQQHDLRRRLRREHRDAGQRRSTSTDNIIANVTQAQASHVILEFASAGRERPSSPQPAVRRSAPGLGQRADASDGRAARVVEVAGADPQFVNAAGNDFHLKSTSPALGAGGVNSVYGVFQQRYGISIAADIEGTPRPSSAYALGAYEKPCAGSVPGAPQNLVGSNSASAISLQWAAPLAGCSAAPSNYMVEIGNAPGSSNLANAAVGAVTAVTLPATAVPPGSYYFRVRAQNAAGTGARVERGGAQLRRPGRTGQLHCSENGHIDDADVDGADDRRRRYGLHARAWNRIRGHERQLSADRCDDRDHSGAPEGHVLHAHQSEERSRHRRAVE